jgi:hypothetical protein
MPAAMRSQRSDALTGNTPSPHSHSKLDDGKGHGEVDDVLLPPPPPDPDPLLVEPVPAVFGLVGTLQKVAVSSSMQMTPVVGPCDAAD